LKPVNKAKLVNRDKYSNANSNGKIVNLKTTDLCDRYADTLQIAEPALEDFGGSLVFDGPIVTLKVFEDDALVRTTLEKAGQGQVLVVDGGGSMHCALVNEQLAKLAKQNGWLGLIVNGCIRHSAALAKVDVGIRALAKHPRNSFKHGVGEKNVPVRFAGIHFMPGHYVYADEDGLVVSETALP
jgi:regulator of ribonuclease activity A